MTIKINDFIKHSTLEKTNLLKSKYNLEVNENALFKAIFMEDLELLELLHNCSIDFNMKINNTYPLHFAAFRGNLEVFKYIYARLNYIDLKSLSTAILNNKTEIVSFIISEMNNEKIQLDIDEYIDESFTPLSLAIMVGNYEITKKLLDLNPDINKIELKRGDTPLMLAINSNNPKIVELLLNSGANSNFVARDGFTPLIVACYVGNLEVVKCLLKFDSDLNYTTLEGFNALMISLSNNKNEVARFIEKAMNHN